MDTKFHSNPNNELMIKHQIIRRGITDPNVIEAFRKTPREFFMPEHLRDFAYLDSPQPIGYGQTISQPYMVARMTQLLQLSGDEKVLEIGTGSGYQAAILSHLAKEVYTIERFKELAEFAKQNLKKLNIKNVHIFVGDGSLGLEKYAPYDRIIITCAVPHNHLENSPLIGQLKDNGFILAPVGSEYVQKLTKIIKYGSNLTYEYYDSCVFVKMIGEYGWSSE